MQGALDLTRCIGACSKDHKAQRETRAMDPTDADGCVSLKLNDDLICTGRL